MTRKRSTYLALLAVLLSSMAANADLIEVDLNAVGDGLVTRDTNSGLEWLDLSESLGLSVLNISDGIGGFLSDGWSIATSSQVCGLLGNIGITIYENTNNTTGSDCTEGAAGNFDSNLAETIDLVSLLGINVLEASVGYFDGGSINSGFTGGACIQVTDVSCSGGSPGGFFVPFWTGAASAAYSTFLVREYDTTSVPEPGTLALLGIGLLGMAATRRRKKV